MSEVFEIEKPCPECGTPTALIAIKTDHGGTIVRICEGKHLWTIPLSGDREGEWIQQSYE